MKITKSKTNYVDKAEMQREIESYKACGVISPRLHEIFWTMSKHIVRKSLFIGFDHAYKEDLVTLGYIRCITYGIKAYSIDRKNPFAYFQSCIERAFWKHRNAEKLYQSRKWDELGKHISFMEHTHRIQIALPDDVKEKMYMASATSATVATTIAVIEEEKIKYLAIPTFEPNIDDYSYDYDPYVEEIEE